MSDMLANAVSALTSYQRALATTGHNIANANTEGYSRQRVDFAPTPSQNFAFGTVGSGVQIDAIRRNYDQFVVDQMRTTTSTFNQLDTFNELATQVGDLLGDTTTGVSSTLSRFFNSLQDVVDNPAAISTRQVLLSEGQSLVDLMDSFDSQLQMLEGNVNTRISAGVDEVNGLADRIAQLNRKIAEALGQGNTAPNDLFDQRDLAVLQLNQYVNVSTVNGGNGAINVFLGQGQALVLEGRSSALGAVPGPFDPTRLEIAIGTAGGQSIVSNQITGGSLGGALQFRDEVLDPVRNGLGRLATVLGLSFNKQHATGMDLSGTLGGDFFTVASPLSLQRSSNTGSATVATGIADLSGLTADDYRLYFSGSAFELYNQRTGAQVATTGSGTAGDPLLADGLSIVVSGSANSGDEFLIRPTVKGASNLGLALRDPAAIAVAAPTRTRTDLGNTGTGSITAGEVSDVTDPQLLSSSAIEFLSPTTYQVNGAGSFTYTAGDAIDINGTRIVITGAPAAGDRFFIESNAGGIGDNRNGLLLADIETRGLLAGATASLSDIAGNLIGNVAVATRSSELGRQTQQTLLQHVTARHDSAAGVNLDEEAADMLRYQQAYQAAARAVSTANSVFQIMLDAVRR